MTDASSPSPPVAEATKTLAQLLERLEDSLAGCECGSCRDTRAAEIKEDRAALLAAFEARDAEIARLTADARRYRYLRSQRFYYYGENYGGDASPREFGIAWEYQDSTPARPSPEQVLDDDIARWEAEQSEDDAQPPSSEVKS